MPKMTNSVLPLKPDDFWSFSLNLYAKQTAKQAFLSAQNSFGADVNTLLLLAWLHQLSIKLTPEGIDNLIKTSNHWQTSHLHPIRAKRLQAKGTGYYEDLKKRELNLEQKAQQALITSITEQIYHSPTKTEADIDHYLKSIHLKGTPLGTTIKSLLVSKSR
jgi:uncharacterized protein (TIGR02444 family)